ncbi:hypothetical protein ACFWY5_21455 [Nonomuraea sp. NPDC059007]|uniref:hypothetical protein n=1 Tax=Nonomuraea sp. NPDC059007 TaxID=3346692 RepID=UPI00369E2177
MELSPEIYRGEYAESILELGKAVGRARAQTIALAAELIRYTRARDIRVTAEQRAIIERCTDVKILDGLTKRAVSLPPGGELFIS